MSSRVGTLRQRLLGGVVVFAALATAAPGRAQEPARDSTAPRVHVVKRGDTLWDLSQFYLGSPWIWPRIYRENTRLVKDPHWIYPGQRLTIPTAEEVARVLREVAEEEANPGDRTRFYRPPQVVDASVLAAERRPAVDRNEFLAAPWIADAASLPVLGRMLDRVRVEGQAEKLAQLAVVQDQIYVRAEPGAAPPPIGAELLMVRFDRLLEGHGTVVEPTALLRVERSENKVAVARIAKQFGPVLQGQRALPLPTFTPPAAVAPQPVERGPEGEMFAFLREQPLHTTADLAFVTLGRAEGIQLGDELIAYAPRRPSGADASVEVPPEDVARVRVVRVAEHTATVRVLSMRLPSLQPGLRVRLVARVP